MYGYLRDREPEAAFLIHTGDVVQNGNVSDQWQYYYHQAKPLLNQLPIMAAVGNHDGGVKYDVYFTNFKSRFNYQTLLSQRGMSSVTKDTVYSFEYGDALFVVLNAMVRGNDVRGQWQYAIPDMVSRSTKKWKIAVIHIPPYSIGKYYNIDNAHGKILSDARFDLVLSGHEHQYFRTTLHTTGETNLDTSETIRVSPETGAGTTYVIGGTANGYYRGEVDTTKDTSFNEIYYDQGGPNSNQPGMYARVDVSSDKIVYTQYALNQVIDQFTIRKSREEFETENKNRLSRAGVAGMPKVGEPVSCVYTPQTAKVSIHWERSADGLNWTQVATNASSYTPVKADVGYFLRCVAKGTGTVSGTATSLPSKQVQIL